MLANLPKGLEKLLKFRGLGLKRREERNKEKKLMGVRKEFRAKGRKTRRAKHHQSGGE